MNLVPGSISNPEGIIDVKKRGTEHYVGPFSAHSERSISVNLGSQPFSLSAFSFLPTNSSEASSIPRGWDLTCYLKST
ncbi:hypothetical protein L6164_001758 [Bauhinia variegata]|uniref:Uncharacterized protein n=1 Tax=Bauhinia variegata TaxID=167791 RepID=A0ACB9QA04_BAUVA|nr:hypothetical protein L6164_001758 [Bauhinia variegata]